MKKNIEYVLIYVKNIWFLESLTPIYKNTELMTYIEKMKMENKSFKYTNVLYKMNDIVEYTTIKDWFWEDIKVSKVNSYEIKTVKQIAQLENISEEEVYNKYFDKVMTTTNAQTSIRQRVWDVTADDDWMFIATFISKSWKNKWNETNYIFMWKQKVLVIWLKDTTTFIDGKAYKQEKIWTYWDGFSWINVTKEWNVRFENWKKPIDFIWQMLELSWCKDDDIILDFFSWSWSTAHAVMEYNLKHDSNLRWILVQLPEIVDESNKDYINYLKEEKIDPIISHIARERIKRAWDKIKEESGADIDYWFRTYKVDSSNMKDVFYKPWELDRDNLFDLVSNIKEDRTGEDVLTQVILNLWLPLDLKIEEKKIWNYDMFFVEENYLIACFNDNIDLNVVEEIAKYEPKKVVFKDSSFKSDQDKINLQEKFKRYSPSTEINIL